MKYKIVSGKTEDEYRDLFRLIYCLPKCIDTYDGMKVKFYEDMFDHAFFTSNSRFHRDKSILSIERTERITWIKDALEDNTSISKIGWNKDLGTADRSRRVIIVNYNYIVVIKAFSVENGKFVTAFLADNSTLEKIKSSDDWK